MNGTPIEILLVEDNPGDILLTQEAFLDSKIANNLHIARDGVEAWERLNRNDEIMPDLILLDLNLPRMDGRQLLAKIKQDPKLKRIPVVILTTSTSEDDILKTYELHANAYVPKPVDLEKFASIIASLDSFWFAIVKLPTKPNR